MIITESQVTDLGYVYADIDVAYDSLRAIAGKLVDPRLRDACQSLHRAMLNIEDLLEEVADS